MAASAIEEETIQHSHFIHFFSRSFADFLFRRLFNGLLKRQIVSHDVNLESPQPAHSTQYHTHRHHNYKTFRFAFNKLSAALGFCLQRNCKIKTKLLAGHRMVCVHLLKMFGSKMPTMDFACKMWQVNWTNNKSGDIPLSSHSKRMAKNGMHRCCRRVVSPIATRVIIVSLMNAARPSRPSTESRDVKPFRCLCFAVIAF